MICDSYSSSKRGKLDVLEDIYLKDCAAQIIYCDIVLNSSSQRGKLDVLEDIFLKDCAAQIIYYDIVLISKLCLREVRRYI